MNLEPEEAAWTGGRTAGRCAAGAGGLCGGNTSFVQMFGVSVPTADGPEWTGGG